MSTLAITLVLGLLIVLFFIYYFKLRRLTKFYNKFPAPPTEFLLGNARDFKSTSDFFKTLHKYTEKYGSIVHVRLGPVGHVLVCSDYNLFQFILNDNKSFIKTENLRYLKPWIGSGLVCIEGDTWKRHRRLITPAFHFKILEKFVSVFESGTDTLIKKLSNESGNTSVDIHPYISRCTLDIICETAMGTKIDAQNQEFSQYLHSVREMCRIFATRSASVLQRYDLPYFFTRDYGIQEKALEYIHGHTNRVLETKITELNQRVPKKASDDEENVKEKKVFLDLILENSLEGQGLSQREIRDEVNTFMFGGHDTTAAGSSLVLYCLANHKEVQERVLNEQERIFGGEKNPQVTYNNLQEMKYLENVIKESMRVYPPVPLFGRASGKDVVYDGMVIPKGVQIIMFTHGIHMNPKYYPNPEKFDPSRFDTIDGTQPYAYLPFSAGSRNCIGQKYAMLEMKCLVAKIVRNFELTPASPRFEMDLTAETVLKSLNGIKIGLKLRD